MDSQEQHEDGPSQPLGDIRPLVAFNAKVPPVLPADAPEWEKDYWRRWWKRQNRPDA